MSWDIHPHSVVSKRVLVGIEAFERVFVSRVVAVHRGIVLVAEDYSGAGNAISGRLGALPADGFLLVALQLPLAAGEAWSESVGSVETEGASRTIRFGSACQQWCSAVRVGGSKSQGVN